jgi:hypothetical protein
MIWSFYEQFRDVRRGNLLFIYQETDNVQRMIEKMSL